MYDQANIKPPGCLYCGGFACIPLMLFFLAALINYEFGFSPLWKLIDPIFEKPAGKHLGWDINFLFLFGPVLAFIWTFSLLYILRRAKRYGYIFLYIRWVL